MSLDLYLFCSCHLRRLIVEKTEPQFDEFLDDEAEASIETIISDLNENQRQAVSQVYLPILFCISSICRYCLSDSFNGLRGLS